MFPNQILSAIARLLFLALPCLLLISACKREGPGDILFEVMYPVTEFAIPAGQPVFQTIVVPQNSVPTGLVNAIREAGVTAEDIDVFGGLRARVASLSGEDFSEVERIELRACPVGTPGGCSQLDIMFSVDDLFRRRQQTINLNPSPVNFRTLFLGNDNIRIELVFRFGITSSRNLEGRLEWAAAAFGNVQ